MFEKTRIFLFAMAVITIVATFIPGEIADSVQKIGIAALVVGWAYVAQGAMARARNQEERRRG